MRIRGSKVGNLKFSDKRYLWIEINLLADEYSRIVSKLGT